MEDAMGFAKIDMRSFSVGLVVSILGLGMLLLSPADAKQRNKRQPAYSDQSYSVGITVMPRNTPRSNVVCWSRATVSEHNPNMPELAGNALKSRALSCPFLPALAAT